MTEVYLPDEDLNALSPSSSPNDLGPMRADEWEGDFDPQETQNVAREVFPHLALEAVKAGLEKERQINAKITGHIQEAEIHQKEIDLLLDLSAELTAYKEEEEMPEKIKNLLSELKARGIDLHKGEETALCKEKASELKSLVSAQIEKLRSKLNILFSTKIQSLIQSVGAIMEAMKDMIRSNTRVVNAANRLPGH